MRARIGGLLLLLGATACGDGEDAAPKTYQLPGAQSVTGDCEVEPYELGLDAWFVSGDALIAGTIQAVRPALAPAWAERYATGELGLREPDACDEVSSGLVVELVDVKSVALSGELPPTLSLYFGSSHYSEWIHPPVITDSSVSWSESAGRLEPGMRIAVMALQESSTQRWGVPLARREAVFEVRDGQLHAAPGYGLKCGENTPMTELDGHSEQALIERLSALVLTAEDEASIAARRAHQDAAAPEELRMAGTWFAHCHAPAKGDDASDACENDDACEDGHVCDAGECVPAE